MALPHSPYAGITNPQMSFLDDTQAALGQIGVIQCTAAGTNLITLTPVTNMPAVSAYMNLQKFSFVALNTSNAALQIQVGSLAAVNAYQADGTTQIGSAANTGSVVAGKLYEATFLSALNSGSGGFIVTLGPTGITAGTFSSPTLTLASDGRVVAVQAAAAARSYLAGYILSNDSGSPSRSIVVSAGQAADSANTTTITLTSGTAKTIGGTWVAGPSQNGLGTGLTLTSSTWYHTLAIINSGNADVYLDTSVTAANAPAGTTAFRRVGSVLTNNASTSGQISITAFNQNGDEFLWSTTVSENGGGAFTVGTSASTLTLSGAPTGVKVNALFHATANNAGGITNVLLTSPDESDQAVSSFLRSITTPGTALSAAGDYNKRTNTSAQIRARADTATTSVFIGTYGWLDTRGRFN